VTDLFEVDSAGRSTYEQLAQTGVAPFAGGGDVTNAFVDANRAPSGVTFTLDGNANVMSFWSAGRGGSWGEVFGDAIFGMGGGTGVTYDTQGNVQSITAIPVIEQPAESYGWNALGQMTSATNDSVSGPITYEYDALGRRVRETNGSGSTYYVWDGDTLVATGTNDDFTTAQIRVGFGPNDTRVLIGQLGNGNVTFVHPGADGSALAATDANGNLVEGYRYSSYGQTTFLDATGQPMASQQSVTGNRFLFQGQLYDPQLGLYYMRAREYKPSWGSFGAWGRFLSRDPLGSAAGPNEYAFVEGKPLTMADPSGMCETKANAGQWVASMYGTVPASIGEFNDSAHQLHPTFVLGADAIVSGRLLIDPVGGTIYGGLGRSPTNGLATLADFRRVGLTLGVSVPFVNQRDRSLPRFYITNTEAEGVLQSFSYGTSGTVGFVTFGVSRSADGSGGQFDLGLTGSKGAGPATLANGLGTGAGLSWTSGALHLVPDSPNDKVTETLNDYHDRDWQYVQDKNPQPRGLLFYVPGYTGPQWSTPEDWAVAPNQSLEPYTPFNSYDR
jgi:RHS repeat-associated protein